MRRILALPFLFWSALAAWASPFLVCDPVPGTLDQFTKPVSYVISGLDSSPITTPAFVNPDGTVQLRYDLSQLPHGTYTVTAAGINLLGGIGPYSAPPFYFHVGRTGRPH